MSTDRGGPQTTLVRQRVALACGVITLVTALVPVIGALAVRGWKPSALVRMAREEPIAPLATAHDAEFRFVDIGAHYDGVYFYAIALDPFAQGEAHTLIDNSAYRYGHAGYGWLARVASLGRASAVPTALLVLGLVGLCAAAVGTSLLAAQLGLSGWLGLAVAFNPGLLYSLTALTSETVAAPLLVFGLLFWIRGKHGLAGLLLVALCFIKEPWNVVPVGLGLWEILRWTRAKNTPETIRRLAILAIGPVLFILWFVYLRTTFGQWPVQGTEGFFSIPLAGWIETIREASRAATGDFFSSQIGAASAPMLAATGAALLVALAMAIRPKTAVEIPFVLITLVALTLRPLGLLYPKDQIREVALQLLLVPIVFGIHLARTRATARDGETAGAFHD